MSIFVLNIATMLGLALAIDYSLFIVSRFREELRRGRTVGDAVERAVGDRRQGGRLLGHRGRHRAVRPAPVPAPAIRSIGIAGLARRALLGRLRADLPAGGPRDARPSRERAVDPRPSPSLPARSPTASRSPGRRAGSASPTRSCAARSPSSSRRSPSCSSSAPRSSASSRASRAPRSTRPASRAATRTSRSRPSSPPGETTPIIILADVTGSPTEPRQHQGARRLRAPQVDARRRRRPGREPVRHPRPGDRRAPDARAGRGALRAARRPASGRASTPCSPSTSAARPSASTPSARCAPSQPEATAHDPGDPGASTRATGSRPRSAAAPRSATTSSSSQAERAPVRRRPDPARERLHPVPAVRLGRPAAQGRDHDPAVDHAPASGRWSGSSRRATCPGS